MSEWASFYILIGSAGAALIGIQFVVVTLIAEDGPELGYRFERFGRLDFA
jgi:hypothetical protein